MSQPSQDANALPSRRRFLAGWGAAAGLAFLTPDRFQARADEPGPVSPAQAFNKKLGRGINLGNIFEAPHEGEWGLRFEDRYASLIHDAGFDSVRIPVRWSTHAAATSPYTIDATFLDRVNRAVDHSLARGLNVVVNFHHIEEIYADPDKEQPRFLALWRQVARHFADRPDRLVFEILNEPHGKLDDESWSKLWPKALAVLRESNPNRFVIVGPAQWNNLTHLDRLQLPDDDRRLIATFHYYSPFEFTHQGAEWAEGSQKWLGRTWTATPEQRAALERDFDQAEAWARAHDRPLFLGEFGAYSKADLASRARWTSAVAREAEKRGFSWAYWEFASGFGAYDPRTNRWREPLLNALIPRSRS